MTTSPHTPAPSSPRPRIRSRAATRRPRTASRLALERISKLVTLVGAALAACQPPSAQPPAESPPPPTPEPPPPEHVEGELAPGTYFFPGEPVALRSGEYVGHLIGLVPVEVIGPASGDEGGYEARVDIGGERRDVIVGRSIMMVHAHRCLTEATTVTNGQLEAELAPGSVVGVVAMDERWAEIQIAAALRGVVPRDALSVEGCVGDDASSDGSPELRLPSYAGPMACLFAAAQNDAAPIEAWPHVPARRLERRGPWSRVETQHGAITLRGWLPDPSALPPDERPPTYAYSEPGFSCRRTTRALTVGDAIEIEAPPGSIVTSSRYWTNVYVQLAEGQHLHLREEAFPDDATGEEERCDFDAWEPWEGYLGQCFVPGMPLEETDASPRFYHVSGERLGWETLTGLLRGAAGAVRRCNLDGTVHVAITLSPDGAPRVETSVDGEPLDQTTIEGEDLACAVRALSTMSTPPLEAPATFRVRAGLPLRL